MTSISARARGVLFVIAAAGAAAAVAPGFLQMHEPVPIAPGEGVTRVMRLSNWFPALTATPGDTPVYELEGREPGGTILIVGGTHADEPAGHVAAVILVERVSARAGRLLVIPRANASGFSHDFPQEAHPTAFTISAGGGVRRFAFGARATNPVHQWPDPQVYTLPGSGQVLSGTETRNLNRAYPGRPDGSLTERIAWAITSLIRRERVDLAIDLHEASPEYPVVNTIVAHPRAMELAASANLALQGEGIEIGLEESPANLHGLSHREWGDATPALAVLMETTNPAQGRLRGRTDAALVIGGRDRFYARASDEHRLSVPFPGTGWPLDLRVARHLAGVQAFAAALSDLRPGRAVILDGVPSYDSIVQQGIGAALRAPASGGRVP